MIALNFPDEHYPHIAPWSKNQVDALSEYTCNDIEVIAPRPYSFPIKVLPYNKFSLLPRSVESNNGYIIHYPRFLYPLPKCIFFPITGDFYSHSISKYLLNNLKRPDLIHARFGYLDGYGSLKASQKWGIPQIIDVHGYRDVEIDKGPGILRKKQIKAINHAKKILCAAKWQVDDLAKKEIPKNKLEYVPLGTDTNLYKPRNRNLLRKVLNIREEKIVLFVGQLLKEKGVDSLLKSIYCLEGEIRERTKFIFIGEGPEKDCMIRLAREKGILNSVKFTGYIGKDYLSNWYSAADIFVLPSLGEGRPMVINEAMASECAIIATHVKGISEQITDGRNGFLIEPGNYKSLASKMSYLLENEDVATSMGRNGRKEILEKDLTWSGYAKRVDQIYDQILHE